MLTVAEAARRACVGETLVRQWLRDGTLPHLRVGAKGSRGKILIQEEDLDGLLASFKVGVTAKPPPPPPPRMPKPVFKHVRA